MIPRGPHPNPLHLDPHKLLNKLNIRPRIRRQPVKRGNPRRRLALPSRQRLVLHLDVTQDLQVGREVLEDLAVIAVAGGYLDFLKVIEHIQLRDVQRGVVVAGMRVLDDDEIEPPAATLAACGDAHLVAYALQLFAVGVELFGGERAAANARGVGFYDADDLFEGAPAKGCAGEDAAKAGVGGGHEGVGAVVDVEHEGVGAFDEDGGLLFLCGGEEGDGVDDEGGELGAVVLVGVREGGWRGEASVVNVPCSGRFPPPRRT